MPVYILRPQPAATFLTIAKVCELIASSFSSCEIKKKYVEDVDAELMAKLNASMSEESFRKVSSIRREAVICRLATSDTPEAATIRFLLLPDTPIQIRFSSIEHESRSRNLLHQLASTLCYEIVPDSDQTQPAIQKNRD